MIKRFFAIAIVMFLTLAVHAQRFDWVRSYLWTGRGTFIF